MMRAIRTVLSGALALLFMLFGVSGFAFASDTAASDTKAPVVVLFTDSIRWADVTEAEYPNVARWAARSTMANMATPNISGWVCPQDVTLAMSANEPLGKSTVAPYPNCHHETVYAGHHSPDAPWWDRAIADSGSTARIGLVATELADAGISVAPIGNAAAAFLVSQDAVYPKNYAPAAASDTELATQVATALDGHQLVVADVSATDFYAEPSRDLATERKAYAEMGLDIVTDPLPEREELAPASLSFAESQSLTNLARLDAVLGALPESTTVLTVSLTSSYRPILQPMFYAALEPLGALAWDTRVRHEGTISYTSIVPTMFQALGHDPAETALRPEPITGRGDVTGCAALDECFTERIKDLESAATKSYAITVVRSPLFSAMQTAAIIFFLLVTAVVGLGYFARRKPENVLAERVTRPHAAWLVVGLAISAIPLASLILSAAVDWWEAPNPRLLTLSGTFMIAVLIGFMCWLIGRRVGVVAPWLLWAVTTLAFLAEVLAGSRHLIDAPMGFNTLIGARFYGLGNEGFAVLASAALLTLALLPIRSRKAHVALAGGVGIAILGIIVLPTLGADFGGGLSFLPALLVLLALLSRITLSWRKVALMLAVTVIFVAVVSVADWLRGPASWTHLGAFVQSVIDGHAWEIIARKLSVNIRLLGSSNHRWVVLFGLLALVATRRKLKVSAASTPNVAKDAATAPTSAWRAGLLSVSVCLVIAFLVNDSGIVLPGMGAITVLPAALGYVLSRPRTESYELR